MSLLLSLPLLGDNRIIDSVRVLATLLEAAEHSRALVPTQPHHG